MLPTIPIVKLHAAAASLPAIPPSIALGAKTTEVISSANSSLALTIANAAAHCSAAIPGGGSVSSFLNESATFASDPGKQRKTLAANLSSSLQRGEIKITFA